MGAIVKELKEKIVAAGGDTTGVQTVSEALDKLPAGGGSGELFVVHMQKVESSASLQLRLIADAEETTYRLDRTWQEIYDAAKTSIVVMNYCMETIWDNYDFQLDTHNMFLVGISSYAEDAQPYGVNFGEVSFTTSTPNGYPESTNF